MATLIALGLMAGVSGMIWVGPRITQMMGKDLPALAFFDHVTASNVPVRAMILQYILVVLLLLTSSFKVLLVSSQFTLICCQIWTVFGVSVLRKKTIPAGSQDIFRCPLYPLPLIIFIHALFNTELEACNFLRSWWRW